MTYSADEARQQLLDEIAAAVDALAVALAAVGAAYEQLDEQSADRLEEDLFRPVQAAYGRAQRTHAGFAERHRLPGRTFSPAPLERASHGVSGLLEHAVDAVADAEELLSDLQDSMAPVEVGDPELRAGLAQVRDLLADVSRRADRFLRSYGR
jgi:hypothetical protein